VDERSTDHPLGLINRVARRSRRLHRHVDRSDVDGLVEETLRYTPKTEPFPHQAKGTLAAARARNYAIFFEPRLGKSKTALDYVGILSLKGEVRKVLILAPKIAIPVWERQIRLHFPYNYEAETFTEQWGENGNDSLPTVQFWLAGREETFRRVRGSKKSGKIFYQRSKQDIVEAWDPDVIVVDESHEYKRPGGVGAQDLWHLVRRLRKKRGDGRPYVLLLSGTPNPKGWRDLFAQFRIMDDGIFGTSADSFDQEYVIYGRGKRRWTIIAYRKEKKLDKLVRRHSIAASADEVGLANEQFFERLPVTLPPSVVKMYHQLVEEFMVEWEGGVISAKNSGVRRLRLLQLCGGFTTQGEQIHSAKVDALKSYLQLLYLQGESVVVYSRFTAEVEAAHRTIQEVGFVSHRVDGSTSARDRRLAIDSLATRPSLPTAIAFQHQAGSRAIELVGAAETVYYSPPDGWVDYWQTLKRTQGPNQHRPVRYTHLVVPGTVDISVIKSLQRKEDWHADLMRNPRRYLTGL